jgi:hypothetical protein
VLKKKNAPETAKPKTGDLKFKLEAIVCANENNIYFQSAIRMIGAKMCICMSAARYHAIPKH